MTLSNFFSLRFKSVIAGVEFVAEVDCDNVDEVSETCFKLATSNEDITLVAARIGFDLVKPDNKGCYILEAAEEGILGDVLKELKMGVEHFMNHKIGWYDVLNNNIKPVDMGIVFPDASLRVVWKEETALYDFDKSFAIVKGVISLLLAMQSIAYFQETPEEVEDGNTQSAADRRVDVLFSEGLWPASDGDFEFECDSVLDVTKTLAPYLTMSVPSAEVCAES